MAGSAASQTREGDSEVDFRVWPGVQEERAPRTERMRVAMGARGLRLNSAEPNWWDQIDDAAGESGSRI